MTSVPSARALRGLAYASLVFLAWCGGDDGGGGRAQGANAALADVSASSRPAPGGEPAILTSPPPGTKFASRSATFVWTNTGANQYGFAIQSTSSATPVVDTVTSATTLTVTNLPTDGAGLVVRLRSRFKGKWLPSNEYSFTAAGYTAAQSTAARPSYPGPRSRSPPQAPPSSMDHLLPGVGSTIGCSPIGFTGPVGSRRGALAAVA